MTGHFGSGMLKSISKKILTQKEIAALITFPLKGDTIQYIYTDSKHNNPLCRVTPIENIKSLPPYDKEKYKEIILDAAEIVLGFFGFDRTAYCNLKKNNARLKWRWFDAKRTESKRYRN